MEAPALTEEQQRKLDEFNAVTVSNNRLNSAQQEQLAAFNDAATSHPIREFRQGFGGTLENMGRATLEAMSVQDPTAPPEARAPIPETMAGRMGEVSAESVAIGLPAGMAATQVPRAAAEANRVRGTIQNVVSDIGTRVRNKPLTVAAEETAVGAIAGGGGFLLEQQFPDTPAARFVGEVIGGFTPYTAVKAGGLAIDTIGKVMPITAWMAKQVKGIFDIKAEGNVNRRVQDRIDRATPDRGGALTAMDEPLIDGLTPAARTGDTGIMSLEAAVEDSIPDAQNFIEKSIASTQGNMRRAIATFSEGNPTATRETFVRAQQEMVASLDAELLQAVRRTDELVQRFSPNISREQANVIAMNEVELALKNAKSAEDDLYALIPQDAAVPTASSSTSYDTFYNELSAAQRGDMPSVANDLLKRGSYVDGKWVANPNYLGETTDIKELRGLQSALRQEARNARAGDNANFNKARIADQIANSITEDIANAQGGAAVSGAVDAAVGYSRELNQKFRQGTVGDLLGYTAQGDTRTQAGLMLERSLGASGEAGTRGRVAFDDIMNAVDGSPVMQEAMDEFVKNRFVDFAVRNGELNISAAESFIRANKDALDRMPQTRNILTQAIETRNAEGVVRAERSALVKDLESKQNIATLFIQKEPSRAFNMALAAPDPAREMNELLMLAGRDETGRAREGLVNAFGNYIVGHSTTGKVTDVTGNFSGAKMRAFIENPQNRAAMEAVYSPEEMNRWEVIATTAERLDMQRAAKPSAERVTGDTPSRFIEVLSMIGGARLGSMISRSIGGGSVQIPSIVSSVSREALGHSLDPVTQILTASVRDESILRELLLARMEPDGSLPPQAERKLRAWIATLAIDVDSEQDQQEQQ